MFRLILCYFLKNIQSDFLSVIINIGITPGEVRDFDGSYFGA